MGESLLVSKDAGVVTLSFNRPQALNALNLDMMQEIHHQLEKLIKAPPSLLIIKGEGQNFMSGGDVKLFASTLGQDKDVVMQNFSSHLNIISQITTMISGLSCPTIAVIEGVCAGYGISLALACDFAICDEKAKFFPAYAQMGLTPDGGASYFAIRKLGYKKAMSLYLQSEGLNAKQAENWGLIDQVINSNSFQEGVDSFQKSIQKIPAAIFSKTKALLLASEKHSLKEQCELEAKAFCESITSEDFAARAQAFMSKSASK